MVKPPKLRPQRQAAVPSPEIVGALQPLGRHMGRKPDFLAPVMTKKVSRVENVMKMGFNDEKEPCTQKKQKQLPELDSYDSKESITNGWLGKPTFICGYLEFQE